MGGYSTRMKKDKAFLQYNNQFWFQIIEKKLKVFFKEVFFSLRQDQWKNYKEILKPYQDHLIFDKEFPFVEGPLKGIFSTFDFFRNIRPEVFFLSQQI